MHTYLTSDERKVNNHWGHLWLANRNTVDFDPHKESSRVNSVNSRGGNMTAKLSLEGLDEGRETLLASDLQDLRNDKPDQVYDAELGCLKEVHDILDLTQRDPLENTISNTDDETSATQQLQSAISDFLIRVSVDLPESPQSPKSVNERHEVESELDKKPVDEDSSRAPFEPRPAPETTDVLERFRDLAKLSADEAIGHHAFSQMISKAKRSLWMCLLAILGTCVLLHAPSEQQAELNVVTGAVFSVAVGSTINYCLLIRKLRRDLASYHPGS